MKKLGFIIGLIVVLTVEILLGQPPVIQTTAVNFCGSQLTGNNVTSANVLTIMQSTNQMYVTNHQVIVGFQVQVKPGAGGCVITNLFPNNYYDCQYKGVTGPPFTIYVPPTNVVMYAADLIVALTNATYPDSTLGWSTAAADARYQPKATNFPGVFGQFYTADGLGHGYFTTGSSGPGGGGSNYLAGTNIIMSLSGTNNVINVDPTFADPAGTAQAATNRLNTNLKGYADNTTNNAILMRGPNNLSEITTQSVARVNVGAYGTNDNAILNSVTIPGNVTIGASGTNNSFPLSIYAPGYTSISNSPTLMAGHNQGIFSDGTNYILLATTNILKLSNNWSLIASNLTPFAGTSGGVNHQAPGFWRPSDNSLYTIAEQYTGAGSAMQILVFDQTLARIAIHTLTGAPTADAFTEASGIVLVPGEGPNGIIYSSCYLTNRVFKWDASTYAYMGYIQMDMNVLNVQGLTYTNGLFYLSSDQGGASGALYTMDHAGRIMSSFPLSSPILGAVEAEAITLSPNGQFIQCWDAGINGSAVTFFSLATNLDFNVMPDGTATNRGAFYAQQLLLAGNTPQIGINSAGTISGTIVRSVGATTFDTRLQQSSSDGFLLFNLTTGGVQQDATHDGFGFGTLISGGTGSGSFNLYARSGSSFITVVHFDAGGGSTWSGNQVYNGQMFGNAGHLTNYAATNISTLGATANQYIGFDGVRWVPTNAPAGGGSGTVTSVAMTVPSDLSVSGSPITAAGTLAVTWNAESANTFPAGPTTGSAATPTWRTLVAADVPSLPASIINSGTLSAAIFPAFTGDITTSAGAVATTLKNTGTAGTYFRATFDAQGRETSGSNPTTVVGFGILDAVSTNGPTIFGATFFPLAGGSNSIIATNGSILVQSVTNQPALALSNLVVNGASAASMFDLRGVWNTSGTPSPAVYWNITNAASGGTGNLFEIDGGASGATPELRVNKAGTLTMASGIAAGTTLTAGGNLTVTTGDMIVATVGRGLQIKGGTNAKIGTATLASGTVTVSTTAVTANSQIFLTVKVVGGTGVGLPTIGTVTAGSSFVINSLIPGGVLTQTLDNSQISWMIVEQN